MASVRSNGNSPHPDPARSHRLPDLDELGSPPPRHRFGGHAPTVAAMEAEPTPEEWMRRRFPTVFRDFTGPVFERTQKGDRITRLGPHTLFARCLGPEGTPDAPLVYCPGAPGLGKGQGFYRYDPGTGIYEPLTWDEARIVVYDMLGECAESSDGGEQVHSLRKNRKCDEVLRALKGVATVPMEDFLPGERRRHVDNGILDLDTLTLDDWSPEERSLSRLPVTWERHARFPRLFVGWIREMFPEPDDRDLLLSVMAMALLGNPEQKLVIVTGDGGSGKTTLVKLMAALVGREASGQLRLDQLDYQFEPRRWYHKLLLWTDEANGTIRTKAAKGLKRLSGQSEHVAELKRSNATLRFQPRALPVLVANGRVEVEMDDDQAAWSRRLIVLEAACPGRRDEKWRDFERKLLEEDGPGILRLVAVRAQRLLRQIDAGEPLDLQTPRQHGRAHRVLRGFDPFPEFVDQRLEPSRGTKTYRGEVYEAAREWLRERDYQVPHRNPLARRLTPLVERMGATEYNRMPDHPEYSTKGWNHIRVKPAAE